MTTLSAGSFGIDSEDIRLRQEGPMNAMRLPDRPNRLVPSPLPGRDELDFLKQIVLFSEEDERALHSVWRALADQTDDYLDVLLWV